MDEKMFFAFVDEMTKLSMKKDGGLGRVAGRAAHRLKMMKKDKKPVVVRPTGALRSSLPMQKRAGESFINEMLKISGVSERVGAWVGKALKSIRTAPGRFTSSVRKGYGGKSSVQKPGTLTLSRRNVAGGDPLLATSVERALTEIKRKKSPFPSMRVRPKSSVWSSSPTRTLIK